MDLYEKKYNEALDAMKMFIYSRLDGDAKLAAEKVFPELRESEDERISRWLITQLENNYKGNYWATQAIAWLEKQKENPKTVNSISADCASNAKCEDRWYKVQDFTPDDGRLVIAKDNIGNYLLASFAGGEWIVERYDLDDVPMRHTYVVEWCEIPLCQHDVNEIYRKGVRAGIEIANCNEQKEQKPAEWSEEDKEMFQFAIRCSTLCRQLAINHQMEGLGGETTVKAYENLRNWLSCRFETLCCQPKVEWSEEDEKMVRFYENDYDNNLGNMPMCDVIENRIKFKGWLLNKLKSLRPVKQEWSKKDEDKLSQVMQTLLADKTIAQQETPHCKALHAAYDEMLAWLKSLRPQKKWKPSEELLNALYTAAYIPEMEFYGGLKDKLLELYEQLKKLMENEK